MSNAQLSQKDAVVNFVEQVLGTRFTKGETNVKEIITKDELSQVKDLIFNGILAGEISYSKGVGDHAELKRYISGMVQNYFRKSKDLNGGVAYSADPSKSKKDETLSSLKKLHAQYENEGDSEKAESVLEAIQSREVELQQQQKANKAASAKKSALKKIDTSVLPPELSNMVNQLSAQ
jgi:hypothetical protein